VRFVIEQFQKQRKRENPAQKARTIEKRTATAEAKLAKRELFSQV
jgi:hypothetical protein